MRLSLLAVAAMTLPAVACSASVQHGLDERQANELQTVLMERGFQARKVVEDGRPPTWAVEVEAADAADAVRVLAELGLPRARTPGVRELLKPGLVPDPVEQHALLVEAQSGELARTLEAVDGVVSARVHLVRPQPNRSGMPSAPTKAAVYLRAQRSAAPRLQAIEHELRALVAGSVEGLEPAAVTLVVSEVVSTVPPRALPPVRSAWAPALLGAGVLVLGGASGGAALWARRRARRRLAPAATGLALRPVVQAPLARREAG
ncbi:MAG TPA: flagellar M-ring protein FliF [Myxococcaceae bacterium]|nr:flagellar M-ring protein FliF [Myxococcaceae bacterium]